MYTSPACATAAVSGKGHDQSQTGLASNLMWQNIQLPVICEDNRPHSLFSRHMCASLFATFTFCASQLSLSSHLLPGVGVSRPTCLMQRNGLRLFLLLKQVGSVCREASCFFLFCYDQTKMFHLYFPVLKLRKILGWIHLILATFQHTLQARVCWCKHAWRLGSLAQGHLESFCLALSAPWTATATFQVLKKCQQQKCEAREKSYMEWEKTQFWSSLRKPLPTKPPIHTSNHQISP